VLKWLAFFYICIVKLNSTISFILLILIASCNSNTDTSKVIAKVYDKELHLNDVSYLFNNLNLTPEDSTLKINDFINTWIEEQILIHDATLSNTIDIKAIEQKAEHYKNTLIIHQLENEYIAKNLDTTISQASFESYYSKHKNDFQLNGYLVKVLYVKVPIDAPQLNELNKWYKLNKPDDISRINDYSKLYATNFYYDENNWIYFDDLTKEIPLKEFNKDRFITRKSKKRIEENNYIYYINVIDYKLKNSLSPIEFEKDNLKQRILNIRIKELREAFKNNNITKAKHEKSVKIY